MNRVNITEDEARIIQNELNDVSLAEDSINMLYFYGLDNLIPKISRDKPIEISRAYEESVFKNSSELEQEAVEFVLGKTWMSFERR